MFDFFKKLVKKKKPAQEEATAQAEETNTEETTTGNKKETTKETKEATKDNKKEATKDNKRESTKDKKETTKDKKEAAVETGDVKVEADDRIPAALRERYAAAGQEQVFQFVDKLSKEEVDKLVAQLESLDLDFVQKIFSATMEQAAKQEKDVIESIPPSKVATVQEAEENATAWSDAAYEAVRDGQVAAVVLSGGQGSRLGFSGPKGMYDVSLPSKKTLFQLHAERILKLTKLVSAKYSCDAVVPWYIMTSPLNDAVTREFFEKNAYFGLSKDNVTFFAQGTLPCMTTQGKLILADKCTVATAPDGNGGIYSSMDKSGVLADMEKRGIKYIHAYAIDNILVQVADPVFVGYCITKGADVGNKACPKSSWDEKVGVMGLKNGKNHIVEYSEISEEMAQQKDEESGRLVFGAGNICNHWYTLQFLREVAIPSLSDSYHVAHKKIPCADPTTGETVKPTANNGIKLEMFIFDVFPFSENMAIIECKRSEEFSPVKNAPGEASDSPDTARAMTSVLHRGWLEAAGATLEGDAEALCEVSPLVSLKGEGLEELVKDQTLKAPMHVVVESESKNKDAVAEEGGKLAHYVNDDGVNVYVCK